MVQSIFDLTGHRAFISGSSRGIGFTIARGLAEAGAEIVLNARNAAEVDKARQELAAAGHRVHARPFDVSDPAAVAKNIDAIEAEIGAIDILFNNAGIQRRGPLVDVTAQTWRDVMSVNVDSVFIVGQAVARHMIPRGRGKIVNTCSVGSELARPTIAPYTTSKGAVKMLTKSMCAEWARHGLQINGIGPGYFKTELNVALHTNPAFNQWVETRTPAGRWGELPELVGVAVFLASEASSYVNGQVFYVDGGFTAVM